MTLSGALLLALALAAGDATPAPAPAPAPVPADAPEAKAEKKKVPPPPPDEKALEPFRVPVETLIERMVGSTSRAVRFDWRKKTIGVEVVFSDLVELNNFVSGKVGLFARMPVGGWLVNAGLSWANTWGSPSTDVLALTPYRQFARPSRVQLEANVAYPLVEGVGTVRTGFIPATELVLSAVAGIRYLYYPGSVKGFTFRDAAGALAVPQLSDREVDNLESARLPGMEVDRSRYGALAGLALDVYFSQGTFLSPRAMISPPVLSYGTRLGWWWELTASVGWMF